MKRLITAAVALAVLASGAVAIAGPLKGHPNLQGAQKALHIADEKLTAAQHANEYDMDGHAAKAKDLITQALAELDQAAKAANK